MIALKLLAALVCFLLTTSVFFWAANDAQRDVYMDEVFHVPQAQRYCDGNFTAVINAFSFVCFILISMHKVVFPILNFLRNVEIRPPALFRSVCISSSYGSQIIDCNAFVVAATITSFCTCFRH